MSFILKRGIIASTLPLMFFAIAILNIGYSFTYELFAFSALGATLFAFIYLILSYFFSISGIKKEISDKFFLVIFTIGFIHFLFLPRQIYIIAFVIFPVTLFLYLKCTDIQKIVVPIIFGVFATLIGAIFSSHSVNINNYPVSNAELQKPSVIHIVFDGYASKKGLPSSVVNIDSIDNINQSLVASGFDVYTNSVSRHSDTKESLTDLFNKNFDWSAGIAHVERPGKVNDYDLLHGDILAEISKNREIITWSTYLDIYSAIPKHGTKIYRNSMKGNEIPDNLSSLKFSDQFRILASRMEIWFRSVQQVQLFNFLYQYLNLQGFFESIAPATNRLHPIKAVELLDDMIEGVIPKMGRGQYLFSHVVLPHFPYVLSEDCEMKGIKEWSSNLGALEDINPASANLIKERFADYIDQLKCANMMQHKIITAINNNPKLNDAIVIFHGDHGSKIIGGSKVSVSPTIDELDINPNDVVYSTFFAVRLNAQKGKIIKEHVTVQDKFKQLFYSHF